MNTLNTFRYSWGCAHLNVESELFTLQGRIQDFGKGGEGSPGNWYVYCTYFSDLDGALYLCYKLLFCTWPIARIGVSGQMRSILFPVCFQFVFSSKSC